MEMYVSDKALEYAAKAMAFDDVAFLRLFLDTIYDDNHNFWRLVDIKSKEYSDDSTNIHAD